MLKRAKELNMNLSGTVICCVYDVEWTQEQQEDYFNSCQEIADYFRQEIDFMPDISKKYEEMEEYKRGEEAHLAEWLKTL
ncbi:MAG TPA: hypothetical protein PLV21_07420 [Cyclobacteriaceae bacterium]|nr:hypothetical protein [Cyclobacteriaceae bacterium]HRJ81694.1 hypothetical protein [Cyclobacteriaceae bacterium]